MPSRLRGSLLAFTCIAGAIGCRLILSSPAPHLRVWYVAAPNVYASAGTNSDSISRRPPGRLVLIDTVSLKPIERRSGKGRGTDARSDSGEIMNTTDHDVVVFSTFRGSRYHPESLRALTEDSTVLARFADSLASMIGPSGLYLDLQQSPPSDMRVLMAFVRAVSRELRKRSSAPLGIIVPAGDTISYPTGVLARAADLIVVRLAGEHGPGTPPGPIASPDFIRRALGMRSLEPGASRLVAELPLYGFIWDAAGTARPISFTNAAVLVARQAETFRRDPPSRFLTATGRDGWTIWVPDKQTLDTLVGAARTRGVDKIALSGSLGADPAVFAPGAFRR